jgi:hypothetical protein
MLYRVTGLFSWGVTCSVLSGCIAQVEPDAGTGGGPGETVATERDGLSNCGCGESSYPAPITVNGTVIGPTRSSNICWPVRYDRRTSGVTVDLVGNDQDGNWVFNGIGQVQCISRCCFFDTEPGAERTLTNAFTTTATDTPPDTGFAFAPIDMWNEDAIALLTGVRHTPSAMGTNDAGYLSFTGNANVPVKLVAQTDAFSFNTESVTAVGYSFFVGVAHTGHLARKFRPPMLLSSQTLDTSFPMSRGICTISDVTGAGSSSSAAVTLTRSASSHTWVATTGPSAAAGLTCYDFNQTPL